MVPSLLLLVALSLVMLLQEGGHEVPPASAPSPGNRLLLI
jgi:hypothetical protein